MSTLGTSPRQVSPRENLESLRNIVERAHDSILMNRERTKLLSSVNETAERIEKIRRELQK